MEQRIASLEEEVKLLKNQIRTVLLDIKESLANSDWQQAPGNTQAVDLTKGSDQPAPVKEETMSTVSINSHPLAEREAIPAYHENIKREEGGVTGVARPLSSSLPNPVDSKLPGKGPRGYESEEEGRGSVSSNQTLEPLTLVMLLEWLERSQTALGREGVERLVELYAVSRELPETTRQMLKLLVGLQSKDPQATSLVSSLPYLMELDGLFRQPNPASQTVFNAALKLLSSQESKAKTGATTS